MIYNGLTNIKKVQVALLRVNKHISAETDQKSQLSSPSQMSACNPVIWDAHWLFRTRDL